MLQDDTSASFVLKILARTVQQLTSYIGLGQENGSEDTTTETYTDRRATVRGRERGRVRMRGRGRGRGRPRGSRRKTDELYKWTLITGGMIYRMSELV